MLTASDGIDSFPQSFDCTQPQVWNPVDTTLRAVSTSFCTRYIPLNVSTGKTPRASWEHHPTLYVRCLWQRCAVEADDQSEMQGGFYSGLGQQDLDQCLSLYGSDYEKVFFHNNIAQGTSRIREVV